MFRHLALAFVLTALLAWPAAAQDSDRSGVLDVQSNLGDLHMGKDANADKAGLPLYPGAHPEHDNNNDPLNLGIFTESFGMKLIVAKYESSDPPEKILAFYKQKMKKYGTVLECHHSGDNGGSNNSDDKDLSRPLKCEGDNSGPVRELKVGTEGNAHIVSIESNEASKGTTFAIVYLHRRGKAGEI